MNTKSLNLFINQLIQKYKPNLYMNIYLYKKNKVCLKNLNYQIIFSFIREYNNYIYSEYYKIKFNNIVKTICTNTLYIIIKKYHNYTIIPGDYICKKYVYNNIKLMKIYYPNKITIQTNNEIILYIYPIDNNIYYKKNSFYFRNYQNKLTNNNKLIFIFV